LELYAVFNWLEHTLETALSYRFLWLTEKYDSKQFIKDVEEITQELEKKETQKWFWIHFIRFFAEWKRLWNIWKSSPRIRWETLIKLKATATSTIVPIPKGHDFKSCCASFDRYLEMFFIMLLINLYYPNSKHIFLFQLQFKQLNIISRRCEKMKRSWS
jgi:hypothetical protein